MRATLDSKRRAVFPPLFKPGDVFELSQEGQDCVIARRLAAAPRAKLKLVRKGGYLVFAGGPPVTNDDVRRLFEDEA